MKLLRLNAITSKITNGLYNYNISIWTYFSCFLVCHCEHLFFLFLNAAFPSWCTFSCCLHLNLNALPTWLSYISSYISLESLSLLLKLKMQQLREWSDILIMLYSKLHCTPRLGKMYSTTRICCSSVRILPIVLNHVALLTSFLDAQP